MRIRYTPRSRDDLAAIYDHLFLRSPVAAKMVISRIERRVSRLVDFPEIAPVTDTVSVRQLTLVRYDYKIYYRVDRDVISILHIRHAARRPSQGEP